jgi:ribosomal protein S18 acetylase RimI-like enzyme
LSTSSTRKTSDLTKILDFIHHVEASSATRVEPWRWGKAFFNEKFPIKWDMNYLRMTEDHPDATAALIADEAERVQGEAGLEHRKLHADDEALGARLAPGFLELGWKTTKIVVMARYQKDMTRPQTVRAEERDGEYLRPYMERWDRGKHTLTEDDIAQLAGARAHLLAAMNGTNFAAEIDGEVAGWCEYYTHEGVAQIENVCTFEKFRNRGVASSIVMAGIEKAEADGASLVFLLADEDDWPKELYVKLGFETIGYIYEFLKSND